MSHQQSAWDRYRVVIGLGVMILAAASRIGTTSWLLPILGVAIGILIIALPRSS